MLFAALSGTTIALIVVIAVAQVSLLVVALVDLVRRPTAAVTWGTKLPWIAIVVIAEFVGPILYLAVGRQEAPGVESQEPTASPGVAGDDRARRTVDLLYGPEDHV